MFEKGLRKLFKTKSERDFRRMEPVVREVNRWAETYRELDDEALRGKTADRGRVRGRRCLNPCVGTGLRVTLAAGAGELQEAIVAHGCAQHALVAVEMADLHAHRCVSSRAALHQSATTRSRRYE